MFASFSCNNKNNIDNDADLKTTIIAPYVQPILQLFSKATISIYSIPATPKNSTKTNTLNNNKLIKNISMK